MGQMKLVEANLLKWADINSHRFLRWSIGIIYIMYGGLKFFPLHSPAEQLAVDTIEKLTLGLCTGKPAIFALAVMETLLGLCLVFGFRLKWTVYAAVAHMMGTFLPIFFFPEQIFSSAPLSLSLVGQYILKNIVIVGALLVLYSKSVKREGRMVYMGSAPLQLKTRKAGAN